MDKTILILVISEGRKEVSFKIKSTDPLKKLAISYCIIMKLSPASLTWRDSHGRIVEMNEFEDPVNSYTYYVEVGV